MARVRLLKPEFFTDEDLGALPFGARLLFEGLWVLADRDGRLEDRPMKIRAELFPYDVDADVEQWLAMLARPRQYAPGAFITRYEVEGRKYIQINAWRHQNPHPKEKPSTIPPPEPAHSTASREIPRQAAESHGEPRNYTASRAASSAPSDPVQAGRPAAVPAPRDPVPAPAPTAEDPEPAEGTLARSAFAANLLRDQCLELLQRGERAAGELGAAWDTAAELVAASRTGRLGRTLSIADLQRRDRGSPDWLQATADRLRDRVTPLEAAARERGLLFAPSPPLPAPDPAAADLWHRIRERLRADVPGRQWRLWLAPTVGVSATDRLVVAAPSDGWLSHGPSFDARILVAAAAEEHPVVAVDWIVAPDLVEAAAGAA
jgi:hypothetical protein